MHLSTAPAYSLSKSLKKCNCGPITAISEMSDHNPIVPGPIYNVSGLGKRQPSFSHSIGKSKRTEINHRIQQTPSPMHYQPKLAAKSSEKTFPRSSFIDTINENPDPSCYIPQEKHTIRKVIAYSLSSRQPSIMDQKNSNPGPGHYLSQEVLPILTRSKNMKEKLFGSSSRFKEATVSATPGVGNYLVNTAKLSQFDQQYSIGKAEREPRPEVTPGPSDYLKLSFVQENLKAKLGKSLSGRLRETFHTPKTTVDSFHKYLQNPQQLFAGSKASPKYSIGHDQRKMFKDNRNPGPAEYMSNDFIPKHSSTALMPLAEHVEYSDSVFKPGPGTYEIPSEKGLKYSFPKSKSVASISFTVSPGVGRYKIEDSKPIKANSFSKSGRFIKQVSNPSGVGDYELIPSQKSKGTISKSSRFKAQTFSTPGPGDYHMHSLMGYKSQAK